MLCKSILVVEDDEEIRWTLKEILEMEGYQVVVAANGKEGLEILPRMERPCLILLDLMMPVMNGWEFLNIKTKDDKFAPIPVVLVTAYDGKGSPNAGAERLIRKPVELEVLLQVVKDYCKS